METIVKTAREFFAMVRYSFSGRTSTRVVMNIPGMDVVARVNSIHEDGNSIVLTFTDDDQFYSYEFFDPYEWEFYFVPGTFVSRGYYAAHRKDQSMPQRTLDEITVSEFEAVFVSDTFSGMKPVTLYHQKQFWTVMQVSESLANDGKWFIWLKEKYSDNMTRLTVKESQTLTWMYGDKCWRLTMDLEEITDLERIKKALRDDDFSKIQVSGVEMQFLRCHEISKGVLFFVFENKNKEKEYFYAGHKTKLRIFTNSDTLEKHYCLDHTRRMHVD